MRPLTFDARRNIKMKGSVPAFMATNVLIVHPDLGHIVHGSKVQEQSFLIRERKLKLALVPADRVKTRVPYSALFSFRSERNFNRMIPLRDIRRLLIVSRVVEAEFPGTIE
jgi:hypothetical protein